MGLLRNIKQQIVKKSMDKRKKENVFDIEESDNYVMPPDAPSRLNHSHYFSLHNFETKECLFMRFAERGGNDTDEVWLFIKTKEGKLYLQKDDHFNKGETLPCRVECVKAGEVLKYYYDGEVVEAEVLADGSVKKLDTAPKKIKLEGEFTATSVPFEFSFHMASDTMARAVSREKFNKSFQETMSAIHQIHYEQAGVSTAVFTIDGETTKFIDFPVVRDHSYGHRDWNYFDRYVWTIILLEDGGFVHTSLMRYPALKNLQAGFYIKGDHVESLYYCTELDDLKPEGKTPEEFTLQANYIGGKVRKIKAKREYYVPFYFDENFNVNEGVCEYDVDGVKGRGIGEFGFNADKSRWVIKK